MRREGELSSPPAWRSRGADQTGLVGVECAAVCVEEHRWVISTSPESGLTLPPLTSDHNKGLSSALAGWKQAGFQPASAPLTTVSRRMSVSLYEDVSGINGAGGVEPTGVLHVQVHSPEVLECASVTNEEKAFLFLSLFPCKS